MSMWAYVCGAITVDVPGETQAECTYLLQTALYHMPKICGSVDSCGIYIVQREGYNTTSNDDESYNEIEGVSRYQSTYIVVLSGDLMDVSVKETYKNVVKFLCRLSKRIWVKEMSITIRDVSESLTITNKNFCFTEMFEV